MWSMVGRCNTSAIERVQNVGSPPKCQSAFDSDPLSASNCDPPPEGGTGGEAPPPGQPAVWPDGCLPFHRCLMKRSCYSQRAGSNSDADSPFYGSSLHAFQQDTKSSEEKPGRVSYVPSAADLGSNTQTGRWETTTRHCQGSEGHSFGADPESEFLGLQLRASTPVA